MPTLSEEPTYLQLGVVDWVQTNSRCPSSNSIILEAIECICDKSEVGLLLCMPLAGAEVV